MPTLKLASRSAGRKLVTILALLLIPVAALLYVYTNNALVDVRLGQRQLSGVAYLEVINKVYGAALNGILICVSDNGPGIPADKLPMVKEPLFTTKSFGPGLGLAIVDQVTALHGGTVEVKSELGNGTEVLIWLPFEVETERRIGHM